MDWTHVAEDNKPTETLPTVMEWMEVRRSARHDTKPPWRTYMFSILAELGPDAVRLTWAVDQLGMASLHHRRRLSA